MFLTTVQLKFDNKVYEHIPEVHFVQKTKMYSNEHFQCSIGDIRPPKREYTLIVVEIGALLTLL